jgi:hypothetical protein
LPPAAGWEVRMMCFGIGYSTGNQEATEYRRT